MTALERFFDDYAAAFSSGDVEAVTALWTFPAFIAARGKRAALDAAAFRANTEALIAFYRARGMARAEKRLISAEPLSDTLWLARTADRMTDSAGAELAAWEHFYLLSRTAEGLRAIAAFPDSSSRPGRTEAPRSAAGESLIAA